MKIFEYHNPEANKDRGEDPRHTFELKGAKGETIAGAEIDYYSKPIPHYQVTDIWVDFEHQGQGIASELMGKIEEMLKAKKRAGFLVDAIMEGNPTKGFYERRGWIPVPGGMNQFVFNLPRGAEPESFISVENRQTPIEERNGSHPSTIPH
ncbi:MAG: GNAT family N-acetyltransferase [Candidatus Uhrbacteria bacterium]|nr:GNAT family N-acetyltransferase [Candidatus Uhrbacteria bacterium]